MDPFDRFHHRLSAAEEKARKVYTAPSVPKYALSTPGAIIIEGYQFTTYGATYQVRRDINPGDTITVDLSNSPDLVWVNVELIEMPNMKFASSPSGTPWSDEPFGGSAGGGSNGIDGNHFIFSTDNESAFSDDPITHFGALWTSNTYGTMRSFEVMYDWRGIRYVIPEVPALVGVQPIQEDYTSDVFSDSGWNNAPHAGWTFWYNWDGGVVPNDGIQRDLSFHSTSYTAHGVTIVRMAGSPSIFGASIRMSDPEYFTNVVEIVSQDTITAPNGLVLLCHAFSTVAPSTDAERYPASITDDSTSSGSVNRLLGRASGSHVSPLRSFKL